VVVNERLNVPRPEYDRVKAIVHDAVRNGPDAANRAGVPNFRAHLEGRIAWIASLHPKRGRWLRERFAQITW
jgi:RNA-directed DNA polymerase